MKQFPIPKNILNTKIRNLIKYCTEIHPEDRIKIKEVINMLNEIFLKKIAEYKKELTFIFKGKEGLIFANKVKLIVSQSKYYEEYIYLEKKEKEYVKKMEVNLGLRHYDDIETEYITYDKDELKKQLLKNYAITNKFATEVKKTHAKEIVIKKENHSLKEKIEAKKKKIKENIIRKKKFYNQKLCDFAYLYMTQNYEKLEELTKNLSLEKEQENTNEIKSFKKSLEEQIAVTNFRKSTYLSLEERVRKTSNFTQNLYNRMFSSLKFFK
jgi:hypothetical protein